jgi:hypothetical protein
MFCPRGMMIVVSLTLRKKDLEQNPMDFSIALIYGNQDLERFRTVLLVHDFYSMKVIHCEYHDFKSIYLCNWHVTM